MPSIDFLSRDEKIRLLRDMLEMTQDGKIKWRVLGSGEPAADAKKFKRSDAFGATMTSAPSPSVWGFVLSSVDRDGVAPFQLIIFMNDSNEEVARIRMNALDENGDEIVNGVLSDLYEEVFRRVLRPEEVIRELFQVIDRVKMSPPGRDQ